MERNEGSLTMNIANNVTEHEVQHRFYLWSSQDFIRRLPDLIHK